MIISVVFLLRSKTLPPSVTVNNEVGSSPLVSITVILHYFLEYLSFGILLETFFSPRWFYFSYCCTSEVTIETHIIQHLICAAIKNVLATQMVSK